MKNYLSPSNKLIWIIQLAILVGSGIAFNFDSSVDRVHADNAVRTASFIQYHSLIRLKTDPTDVKLVHDLLSSYLIGTNFDCTNINYNGIRKDFSWPVGCAKESSHDNQFRYGGIDVNGAKIQILINKIVATQHVILGTIGLIILAIIFALAFTLFWQVKQKALAKSSEQQIEQIANELTLLIDTANAPIFGIDADGNVNEWNQQAQKITGFDKEDVMGRALVDGFITDDYKASVGEVLERALKGEETENFEFPLFSKSGEQVDVLLNSTTRRDAFGQIVGVVGVGQDITELNHVRIEQERERKESTAQIIQSSKLATLGEMATSIAHELNQPLNVIRMAVGNSCRKISKGTANLEYLNDKLERIEEQTARAAAIINHMRMFGRNAKEHLESIDPRNVVTNALDLMGEQLRLADIEIVTELAENCPSILGHIIQLEQVILNLLTNARDAMAESEGEAKITLRIFEEDEGVHITCEDTGGGIPEDALPRIFEPFYTTKEMGKGTGLGLSVSYGIIRDMNGTIGAENIDGGARFTVTFPSPV
ncbi:MAG: PAS domain S-box-containing protein [Parasphingorhabdus sp.]|jgi:PAS domain S-box-containing protein